MPDSPHQYLSIKEQNDVRSELERIITRVPTKEKVFYEHGDKLSCGVLLTSNFVFWRSSFRGFNLARYGKFRLISLIVSCLMSVNGAFIHSCMVRPTLTEYYRKESMLYYGYKSLLAHQGGLLIGFLNATGMTFFFAQYFGILPVPLSLHRDGGYKIAARYYVKGLRPYRGNIAVAALGSSLVMFTVGLLEYKQSKALLARIDRKTFSHKE